jgi:hypothetical protein
MCIRNPGTGADTMMGMTLADGARCHCERVTELQSANSSKGTHLLVLRRNFFVHLIDSSLISGSDIEIDRVGPKGRLDVP